MTHFEISDDELSTEILHEEIDRLRAELAESERKHVLRLEAHIRTDLARAKAEAAIARVRAVLADPPVPSRMLIPVIRAAIEGEL